MVDIEEAIRRSVRSFYEGNTFENYEKAAGKKMKHNKAFYDTYEEDLRKSGKVKSKKKTEELSEGME